MARIQSSQVGIASHIEALTNNDGGPVPVQVFVPGSVTASYRIVGRVNPEAPWVEILPARSNGLLETMQFLPYVGLDIISISGGAITLWTGDR